MAPVQLHTRMTSRDPAEAHRTSTPLELFYDLTFVVAIAQLSVSLHHGLVDGPVGEAIVGYLMVFFAIWWAWVNFTAFASAYDTDDTLYRLAVFVQMTGVLILAAGIPRGFDEREFGIMVAGYVVMRLALVAQWLRAAHSDPERRPCTLRYALGVTVVQMAWLVWIRLPDSLFFPVGLMLVATELAVPVWAEAAGRTSWHPGHMAERSGLFTIIVLGESILAAAAGVQRAVDADGAVADVVPVVVGGLLIVFAMWSVYFDLPIEEAAERARSMFGDRMTSAFAWGYGHYFIFAGAGAVGAGLAVAVDQATTGTRLSDVQAGLAVALPVCAYLLAVWALNFRMKRPGPLRIYAVPVTVVLVLAASAGPQPALAIGLILAALVGANTVYSAKVVPPRANPAG
ncbi:MAG: low temperature requirement protein A [Acidimicrobiales bacterium]